MIDALILATITLAVLGAALVAGLCKLPMLLYTNL